jgi:hypothetical protein
MSGNIVPRITEAEHIGPNDTGDNIEAKRVANYVWTGSAWARMAQLNPGTDYDYLDVQQTDADTETYVFKLGGSGGTTVRTIVVNYTDATKEDIDNVSWS